MKYKITNEWKWHVSKNDAEITILKLEWDTSGSCGRYKYVELTILNFNFQMKWD